MQLLLVGYAKGFHCFFRCCLKELQAAAGFYIIEFED